MKFCSATRPRSRMSPKARFSFLSPALNSGGRRLLAPHWNGFRSIRTPLGRRLTGRERGGIWSGRRLFTWREISCASTPSLCMTASSLTAAAAIAGIQSASSEQFGSSIKLRAAVARSGCTMTAMVDTERSFPMASPNACTASSRWLVIRGSPWPLDLTQVAASLIDQVGGAQFLEPPVVSAQQVPTGVVQPDRHVGDILVFVVPVMGEMNQEQAYQHLWHLDGGGLGDLHGAPTAGWNTIEPPGVRSGAAAPPEER